MTDSKPRGAINFTRSVGIEDAHIKVGLDLNDPDGLKVRVDSTTEARDTVVSGPSLAVAGTRAQAGVLNSTISVGENANTVSASETGILSATATATSGSARAVAVNRGPTGGFLDSSRSAGHGAAIGGEAEAAAASDKPGLPGPRPRPDIRIGRSGDLSAVVTNTASAAASATGGGASALSDTGRVAGFRNIGIKVGESGSLLSDVKTTMAASASAVDAAGSDRHDSGVDALAGGRRSSTVGVLIERQKASHPDGGEPNGQELQAGSPEDGGSGGGHEPDLQGIRFGTDATITSQGIVSRMEALSDAVSGKAAAAARADLIAGIAIDSQYGGHDGGHDDDHDGGYDGGSDGGSGDGPTAEGLDGSGADAAGAASLEEHQPESIRIAIGGNGGVVAYGDVGDPLFSTGAHARASTTNGPADAAVAIDTIGGLIDRAVVKGREGHPGLMEAAADEEAAGLPLDSGAGYGDPGGDHHREPGSVLQIGENGSVLAGAYGLSSATAESVTAADGTAAPHDTAADHSGGEHGSTDVVARVDHDNVVAIALDRIKIGKQGEISAVASSDQSASADVVTAGLDPSARVAEDDRVTGILDTDTSIGTTLVVQGGQTADISARLTGEAVATAVSAEGDGFRHAAEGSQAEAGGGSRVAGVHGGSLAIGEGIVNGTPSLSSLRVEALSDLTAVSEAVSGDSRSRAGGEWSSLAGLQSTRLSVGTSGGVNTLAKGSVTSDAESTTGRAEASSVQTARGLEDTRVTIGTSGSVSGGADLSGSAAAGTVTGMAKARLRLKAEGIDQDSRLIRIGEVGSIGGTAKAVGDATASSISVSSGAGDADRHSRARVEASSDLEATGVHLASDSKLAIGRSGDVSGDAVVSYPRVVVNGVAGDPEPLLVSAQATDGPVEASGRFSGTGILGSRGGWMEAASDRGRERGAQVIAGPEKGSISGSAVGAALVAADTTSGGADSSTRATMRGIVETDLKGGLQDLPSAASRNTIRASAEGVYGTRSTTVSGDANAHGDVSVGGLIGSRFGPPSTATINGDVFATAKLVNDVLAKSVTGSASAIAHGDAVGISDYDIHILKSGSINATVSSISSAVASSVTA